ncbi:hypothetical protein [Marinobacter nitratireducens]|uniref:hypothetical protein n=1 Tax=Marinobacter nitratireducens TaxID=1137280 RepID=UPI00055CBB8D|nr:hypothetical protein [Marinobacter nitratireducens]
MRSHQIHASGQKFTVRVVTWIVTRTLFAAVTTLAVWYGLYELNAMAEVKFATVGYQLNLPLIDLLPLANIPNPSLSLGMPSWGATIQEKTSATLAVAFGLVAYYLIIKVVAFRKPATY